MLTCLTMQWESVTFEMKTQSNRKQQLGAISSLLWCYVIYFLSLFFFCCFSCFCCSNENKTNVAETTTISRRRQPLVSAATCGASSVVDVTVVRRLLTTGCHMLHAASHTIGRHLLECGAKVAALPFYGSRVFCPSNSWSRHQK